MSIEVEKAEILALLEKARSRVEQAIASAVNGDLEKAKVRIRQYNEAFDAANAKLGVAIETKGVLAEAQATKDDLQK